MSTPSASIPPRHAFVHALRDWARTDGLTWIYCVKALLAAFLALGVSMALDLPAPKTSMITVFIVMQPFSGAVFSKSLYRLLGTFVGLAVMLALIGLFPQQPELFLLGLALWLGLCTAGATRNRNFRSYGFMLAGYTAALIGLPSSVNPDAAFMSAIARVSAITLGILSAGLVSALVFPRYSTDNLVGAVRTRFASFVDYVSGAMSGQLDIAAIEQVHAGFVADVVGFEATRGMAVLEQQALRLRAGRLSRLNSDFMRASSRFHALHQLMNRLRANSPEAVAALEPYYREVVPLLAHDGVPIRTAAEAGRAEVQLIAYRDALPRRIRAHRAELEQQPGFPLLDFDTAAELLYRFITDLHDYAATYASLTETTHERERWIERYEPHTNLTASVVAGVRTALVMLAGSAFWIASTWPSGATLVLMIASTCALASTSPRPSRMATQMAVGTLFAVASGFLLEFYVYPQIDGFPLMCLVLAPCLVPALWISVKPQYAGYGAGYLIFFCFLAGPDPVPHYDPSAFINDALALLLALMMSALAFTVLLPPTSPWLARRLLTDLRRQAVAACLGRGPATRARFDSRTRDLLHQAHLLAADQPSAKREALRWMFSVLEIGHAALDLRGELDTLPRDPAYGEAQPWRRAIATTLPALAALFRKPGATAFTHASSALEQAIAQTRTTLMQLAPPRDERRQLQRILSHLHFARSALLDPDSPLAAYADAATGTATPTSGAPS